MEDQVKSMLGRGLAPLTSNEIERILINPHNHAILSSDLREDAVLRFSR